MAIIIPYERKIPDYKNAAFVAENAILIGDVVLEKGVSIWFGAVLRGDTGSIVVKEGANIQDNAVVHTEPGKTTTVGRNTTVGHCALVHGCTVGDNTMIGMHSTLMNRCVVGNNCII